MSYRRLHPLVCAAGKWPHNSRIRYTDGFVCEDCQIFVPKSDDRYYEDAKYGRQERLGPQLTSIEEGL